MGLAPWRDYWGIMQKLILVKKITLKNGKKGQHVIGLPFLFACLFTYLLQATLQATT